MSQLNRLPPQNIQAEEAMLGSLLIDPDALFDVADFLRPEMFYMHVNRLVFEAILKANSNNNPIDIITISEILRRDDKLENVGGEPYLVGLVGAVANSVNAESYGRIIEACSIRRDLLSAAGSIAQLAYDEEKTVGEVVDASGSEIFQISQNSTAKGISHGRNVARAYLEKIEQIRLDDREITGIPTGLSDLDRVTSGLNNSDLIILAARPGMGKTSLQNGIGLEAALKQGKNVAFFNLEMSEEQLMQRMIASIAKIDITRLKRGDLNDGEWALVHQAVHEIGLAEIFIDDMPSLSPIQLRTKCRKLDAEHGLDLIVVDYLQLMTGDKNNSANRVQEVGEISRGLKQLARELDVPVLASAQLSRGVESRLDKRPMLSDLRDSGSIEQDADIVMFIYRDDYYNPETSDRPNIAELNIAKHRNGPTATVDMYWNGPLATFSNLARTPSIDG